MGSFKFPAHKVFRAGVLILLSILCCSYKAESSGQLANAPPRGWNSYDSYSWIISEEQFLLNAQRVAALLLPYGYEYVVIDFLWYRKIARHATISSPGFDSIDEWGRPIPDPERWPSTAGGKGFKPIADKVHAMGLKLGIHVMRGISTQAVHSNTPILGAQGLKAADIASKDRPCSWMASCFMSVKEDTVGGRAFIQSLYDLYASWEIDFIKHDCVFGADDLSINEIATVSKAITATGRPMIYSISPGVRAIPSMAMQINGYVNMYRVTGDDWDSWRDVLLHFDVARDFAAQGLVGTQGLNGMSWPDLDMLPLGHLTDPGANQGPHRFTNLTPDEQKTQLTLWAMAKSPIMFGGDMLNLDQATLDSITNRVVLDINANSFGNKELITPKSSSSQTNLPLLRVTSCEDANTTSWGVMSNGRGGYQLCWASSSPSSKDLSGVEGIESLDCLNWDPAKTGPTKFVELNASGERRSVGHGYFTVSPDKRMCLDSSQADQMSHFGSFRSQHISHCSNDESQIWELNQEGKLINNKAGYCAAVVQTESAAVLEGLADATQNPNVRIWIAHGKAGQSYVSFFNLGTESTTVTIPFASIFQELIQLATRETLDSRKILFNSHDCSATDVWSSKDLGAVTVVLSAQVPSHGSVLFSIDCKR